MRKRFLSIVVGGVMMVNMGIGLSWAITPQEYGAAINMVGRQRMLSQKMTKEFYLVALGVDADQNKTKLTATMDLFDKSLNQLISGDSAAGIPVPASQDVLAKLNSVKELWTGFRPKLEKGIVDGAFASDTLVDIANTSSKVLELCIAATQAYVADASQNGVAGSGKAVDIAGRQRMLSQKIAKEVCLVALKVNLEENKKSLGATQNLFHTSHEALKNGDEQQGIVKSSNPAIQTQLMKVEGSFQKLEKWVGEALQNEDLSARIVKGVDGVSLDLLEQANEAVKMYEAESKQETPAAPAAPAATP